MKQEQLLKILKEKSKEIMGEDKYFHDFAHVMGVYKNAEKLLKHKKGEGDRLILLAAALFHDIKRESSNHGIKGAEHTNKILLSIPEFPKNKIGSVAEVISSHCDNKKCRTLEQKLLFDADKMDAFNELGLIRAFMIYSQQEFSLREACFDCLDLIDSFFNKLTTKTAKKLAKKDYEKTRLFVLKLIKRYENAD